MPQFRKPSSEEKTYICTNCRNSISVDYNFCPICGVTVKTSDEKNEQEVTYYGREQRQVSFLKVDLQKKSKNLIDNIAQVLTSFSGKIHEKTESNIIGYFGYPIAQDKDAHQAIYVGLKILNDFDLKTAKLTAHTGEVTIQASSLSGAALKDLEKASSSCPAGSFIATAPTAKLLGKVFETDILKGDKKNVKILGLKSDSDTDEQLLRTPLVGRDIELKRLCDYWDKTLIGKAKIISVTGEPGIGKTRIIDAFRHEIADDSMVWIRGYCSAHLRNSAFQPLREIWLRYNKVSLNLKDDELQKAIKEKIVGTGLDFQEVAPLLMGAADRGQTTDMKFQTRDQIANMFMEWLHAVSIDKPLVFVLEDLHYIDPSSLEVLEYLIDHIGDQRLMMIFTFRPEFSCPWSNHSAVSTINLNRLSPNETKKIVAHMSGTNAFPPEVVDHIVDKTDGVPLFIEELITAIKESDLVADKGGHRPIKGSFSHVEIPSTLRDLLMARLDKLGEAKKLAQLCAVFGHTFTHNYLRIISGYDEARLNDLLEKLVSAGVFSRRDTHEGVLYFYKHILLHEAAYASLVPEERKNYHVEIADMLVKYFPAITLQQPEVIALHYMQGGFIDQATEYYLCAGKRAIERSASSEALHHYTKGLELISRLPPGEGRDRRELPFRAAIAVPLMIVKGWGSDAVLNELQRANELSERLGDTEHRVQIIRGLYAFYVIRGPLGKAHAYAEQLLALARQFQDQSLMLESHRALGHCMFFEGDIKGAQKNLKAALQIYDPKIHSNHAFRSGIGADTKVTGLTVLAWIKGITGYPEQALKQNQEVLDYAKELGHPFSLCYAYGFTTSLYQNMRDYQNLEKYARLTYDTAKDRGFGYWQSWGKIFLAWVSAFKLKDRVSKDEYREALYKGILEIREGLEEYRAAGSEQGVPYALALLAQLYNELGEYDQAESITDEALNHAKTYNINLYDPGILRIKAEAVTGSRGQSALNEILALYDQAIEIASSKSLNVTWMKALLSKYTFLKTVGREKEVVPAMKELYEKHTEGFTILPDLILAHKIIKGK